MTAVPPGVTRLWPAEPAVADLAPLTIAVHVLGDHRIDDLIADVRDGLSRPQKELSPKWFYDIRGSELFDAITRLPEYYQTRAEASILASRADEMIGAIGPDHLVEIGAGTCTKTRLLLDAPSARGLAVVTPFDIDEATLYAAARDLAGAYPGLRVYALAGDFARHLPTIPRLGRRLVAFLGSTIGNLVGEERRSFLATVRHLLEEGDGFLVGLDLVKDPARLVRAYDDSAGVTARFNGNVLDVLNRELGATFDVGAFDHVALWNADEERIEMHLRARRPMTVDIPAADMSVRFAGGETIRTEVSCKFTRKSAAAMLADAGLCIIQWHEDAKGDFAIALAVPSV